MRTLQKLLTCAIAFTILGLTLHAQETVLTVQKIIVNGTVLDKTYGEPVIGAAVMVPGTDTGTITDIDGKFSIAVAPGEVTLVAEYFGYTPKTTVV